MQEIISMKKLNRLSSSVALTCKKSNQLTGFYMRATLALNRLIMDRGVGELRGLFLPIIIFLLPQRE